MKKCVVGIPIYKTDLSDSEKISLQRINQCFRDEDILFIVPENLNFDFSNEFLDYQIFRFPNYFFESLKSYSQLLLSTTFYESFEEYEYLLICQLDVFVLSNRLKEFCDLNYDYIGAPAYFPFGASVGNGGFSLRKISSCIRMLKMRDKIYSNNSWQLNLEMMEDQFFSYCGIKPELDFKVPNVELARDFAIDAYEDYFFSHYINNPNLPNVKLIGNTYFEEKVLQNKKNIPFAMHKYNFISNLWKKRISDIGFKLPEISPNEMQIFLKNFGQVKNTFLEYILFRNSNLSKLKKIFDEILPSKVISMWGFGINGNRCLNLLKLVNIEIICIYDNDFAYTKCVNGILYTNFYQTGLKRNVPILISTSDYEVEISDKLTDLGLKKNQDFFLFSEIEKNILKSYFNF